MAQMGVAAVAVNFYAPHEPASVLGFAHHFGVKRGVKAGPTSARVELRALIEQRRIAANAMEPAGGLREIIMGKGAFGAVLARHAIGKVRELRAPFFICFSQLFHMLPLLGR